jgi:hypothetical protein
MRRYANRVVDTAATLAYGTLSATPARGRASCAS